MARFELELPVKLYDYTCQGEDATGQSVVFDDLLFPGQQIATLVIGDDHFGPYGVVTRWFDGLWIVPESRGAEQ